MKLLKKNRQVPPDVINRILKTMIFCGTCCCFVSISFFHYLSEIIKHGSQKSRILVLQLLENTVYSDLGCFLPEYKENFNCENCLISTQENDGKFTASRSEILQPPLTMKFHSGQSVSVIEKSTTCYNYNQLPENFCPRNHAVQIDIFQELLLSEDFRVVQAVTYHLLRCVPRMTVNFKHYISFNILFPIFLTSKNQYFLKKDKASVFLVMSCLSLYSRLLNDFTFAHRFVQEKGLNHTLDLISIPTFTRNCCSVVEKTVVITVSSSEIDIYSTPSLHTLKNAVDAANAMFMKRFTAIEVGKETDDCILLSSSKEGTPTSNKKDESGKEIINILESVSTFWKTYSNLILYRSILRKYFSQENFFMDCKKNLEIALGLLSCGEFTRKSV